MALRQPPRNSELLLQQWFCERDPARAAALMERLIHEHAEPLIRRIVNFKLRTGCSAPDASFRS
jgi:hypothetical protein